MRQSRAREHRVVPSAPRYLLVAFPAFLLVGRWTERHPRLGLLLAMAGFIIQFTLAGLFLMNVWVD